MNFIISDKQLNQLGTFLGNCPYQQVFQLIDLLRNLKPEKENGEVSKIDGAE